MTKTALVSTLALLLLAGCPKKAKPEPDPEPLTPTTAPATNHPVADAPDYVKSMKASFEKVFFEFDQESLTEEGKAALKDNAKIMADHPDIKLEVQGHADERGTTEYNLALGQRRAEAVKTYLVGLGVATTRVSTITYGEERPADSAHTETAFSKNRRAEFRITWGATGEIKGTVE